MSTGLYSGVSGLALGTGLYKGTQGLWGGASGLINQFGATLNLDFLAGAPLDSRITFSRTTNATLVDATGDLTYAPNNLLTYSEQFDNAAWARAASTITPNAAAAPNGTTTADKLIGDTAATGHFISQAPVLAASLGAVYIGSAYIKASGYGFAFVGLNGSGYPAAAYISVSLSTGAVSTTNGVVTASSAVNVGDGWWRVAITAPTTAAGSVQLDLRPSPDGIWANRNLAQNGTDGVLIWGAQLEAVTYQTLPATYVQTVASAYYGPRFDYNPITLAPLGLLIEEQRTNSIRNNTGVGAVAGTPGTVPTNWSVTSTASGVTREIVGTGTESGIAYIDIKYSGTPSANLAISIAFEGTSSVAAAVGQTWTVSAYLKLQAGSFTGTQTTLNILGTNGTIGTESFSTPNVTSTPSNIATARLSASGTLADVTTLFVQPRVRISVTSGVPVDITLRIGLPQLEQGAFATSVIPTATAQVTRAPDNATMTGTNFSSWYNQSEGTMVAFYNTTTAVTPLSLGVFAVSDTTANERMQIRRNSANANATFIVVDGGAQQYNQQITAASGPYRTALAYTNGSIRGVNNGTLATAGTGTIPTVTQAELGFGVNLTYLNGHLSSITYYSQRLSDAQLQALTS
jgi:hypothetical protein